MRWIQCFSFAFVICFTSAYNTRFIMDEEPKKVDEIENPVNDNLTIEDESIPIKDIVSKIGNHLVNYLKNVPKTGEENTVIEKLNTTIKDINKTTQVIRLTAEYINISANYVLSTINQYMNSINDVNVLAENINTINKKLMSILIHHINSTVNDIATKSNAHTITGEDMLFSISYHLVTAFQDMTNMVLNITSKKNDSQSPEPKVEINNKETQTEPELSTNPKFADTVEVFSPVEIKSLKDQNIPVYYLTSWTDCNTVIRPVCAVDLKIKKYIIFLNDCRRMAHNHMHGTNYSVYGMDVCTGLFLRNPGFSGAQVTPLQQNPMQRIVSLDEIARHNSEK